MGTYWDTSFTFCMNLHGHSPNPRPPEAALPVRLAKNMAAVKSSLTLGSSSTAPSGAERAGEYSASLLERQYPSSSHLLNGVSATLLLEGGHSPTTLSQEEGEEEVSSSTNPLFLEGEHLSSSLSLEGEHPSCTLLLAAENAATPGA
ncbi:hypothetical protein ACOMHN_013213 [Nucella lapillus]